ncbi:hypothetical protein [Wenzhouxiangella sp. XN24]|uniref:multiheme c-type cytochrome n=1 Tax=Wenzhouxiangella sp. XN24 TaxID=2713569 RepID=UPI0013EC2745|nr:hypothetical protein [Wenzhouxiangella sp. XN24]NGX17711.1 hypothetical protein [Wenzhouxiangella sp. XN24]
MPQAAAFSDFVVTDDGTDVEVTFSVTVDGEPADSATLYRAYAWDGTDRTGLRFPPRGDNPGLDLVTFTNDGGGDYTVTIPDGVALLPGNQRYLMILRVGDNDLEVVALGDYPDAIPLAGLASNQACVDCHGASGEVGRFAPDNRGGHYSAPMTVDACVVCHTGGTPGEGPSYGQIAEIIHGIHNSANFPDGEFVSRRDTVYDVGYPTYMTNCSVCHRDDVVPAADGATALEAANAMPVSGPGCLSCHGSLESFGFTAGLEFHLNIPDPTAPTACSACHDGSTAGATVADYHDGLETGRGGIIFGGEDTSVTEGNKFVWTIDGIVDDGTDLAISWSATYDGVAVNPCNATVGDTAPVFHADGEGNLSMLRSYFQGDDPIIGLANAPGQAAAVGVTTDNTTCSGNVATTTIPVDDVDAERGIVALQGKPRVVNVVDPTDTMRVRAFTPTREWVVGDGELPVDTRRAVVDSGECLKCHVGSMYQHGGNRVDNVEMCNLCHNPASNDQYVRVGQGVDASEAYDGQVGETFEMKTMLHAIHSAGATGKPYVIYRNRGIYAWADSADQLPNWPGDGRSIVFGSDDVEQNHTFSSPTYPRALNACLACHVEDFAVLPDPTQAMATTVGAGGDDDYTNLQDDILEGVNSAACMSCHASSDPAVDGALRGHAEQNGWTPQEFPEGRQTIIDAID